MGDFPDANGVGESALSPHFTSAANSSTLGISWERWARAEEVAEKIIYKVQPTAVSEQRRRDVIEYVQRLIRNSLGVEVFPYGSVPLKTYLPDGDIDLSAFGRENLEDLKNVVEGEKENRAARFVVKDVQVINAEVKIVKFIVQNIVVDISFNQIGGLTTLCFLEKVDRLIGADHLFKRSVILIKAWCFYESRLLGAHHGLISTYALETMVLYIFHLFHSTLNGPLAVLYKFLDYYSKFDWENYCVSLNGPVCISSLPAIVVETPVDGGSDLLLSNDFLKSCANNFSVPLRCIDRNSRGFQKKHLNIVDPLKETNNLGRSVSKGNFYRICSAFSYGARKLGGILLQREEHIVSELQNFFSNTIERHRNGQSDVQNLDPSSMQPAKSSSLLLHHNLLRDANVLATSGIHGLETSCDSPKIHTQIFQERVNVRARPLYAPHQFFSNSYSHSGSVKNGNPDRHQLGNSEKNVHSEVFPGLDEQRVAIASPGNLDKDQLVKDNEIVAPEPKGSLTRKSVACSENSNHMICYQGSARSTRSSEYLNFSLDLTGDYDSYVYYLQYGQWCSEHASGVPSSPVPPLPPPQYENKNSGNGIRHSSQFKQKAFSNRHPDVFIPIPASYAVKPLLLPTMTHGSEEMPNSHGTRAYFPNTNQPPHGFWPSMNGSNQVTSRSPRNNGRNMMLVSNVVDRNSHEILQSQVSVEQIGVKHGACNGHQSFSPRVNGRPNVDCLAIQSEDMVGFGEDGRIPFGALFLESRQKSDTSPPRTANPVSPQMQRSNPTLSRDHDRDSLKSSPYILKDKDDFPPLSI